MDAADVRRTETKIRELREQARKTRLGLQRAARLVEKLEHGQMYLPELRRDLLEAKVQANWSQQDLGELTALFVELGGADG
jgi:hypothetical protein